MADSLAARLGYLNLPGRKPINTPHHLAVTSRGVVPHLAHDMFRDHTSIEGVYVALEDCELHLYPVSLLFSFARKIAFVDLL